MSQREAIITWLQDMASVEQRWGFLKANGSWRDTEQPDQVTEKANKLIVEIDPEPKQCYRNSFNAILHSDYGEIEYVEGLAMSSNSFDPTRHAWIEIEESVVELTWHHLTEVPLPPDDATYYGVSIPSDKIEERALQLGHTGPFLPELVEQLSEDNSDR